MFKSGGHLLMSHAGEPFQKLIDRSTRFQVLKERSHRNPRPTEYPGAADLIFHVFHLLAFGPIQHANIICFALATNKDCRQCSVRNVAKPKHSLTMNLLPSRTSS